MITMTLPVTPCCKLGIGMSCTHVQLTAQLQALLEHLQHRMLSICSRIYVRGAQRTP